MADLFDIAVAQALGGSSGGSSDFSTAQVTFKCHSEATLNVLGFAFVYGDNLITSLQIYEGFEDTFEAVLYKSSARVVLSLVEGSIGSIEVIGNATVSEDNIVIITGDCTITIS